MNTFFLFSVCLNIKLFFPFANYIILTLFMIILGQSQFPPDWVEALQSGDTGVGLEMGHCSLHHQFTSSLDISALH